MVNKLEIFEKIEGLLPENSKVVDMVFEGANIVLYTKNVNFFLQGKEKIKEIVDVIKKRIDLRMDESMLLDVEKTKKYIEEITKDAEVTDIFFDPKRSIVVIESKKPGVVIGKNGDLTQKIREKTHWTPKIIRAPAVKSDVIKTIRKTLFKYSEFRRKFLDKVGRKIYSEWQRGRNYWVRLSALGGFREVGRSCLLLQTPKSNVLLDVGVNVASDDFDAYPYLQAPELKIKDIDAVIITHAHLDHIGLLPLLFKYGYDGPVYMTEPTRDIGVMLQLDYIDVAVREGKEPIYSSTEIKEMIKHIIPLNYGEVTDIAPDIRITLLNSGHVLGSSMVHLNIGDGFHNVLYTGDLKYGNTLLLDKAITTMQRLETLIIESTYGGSKDIQTPRQESIKKLVEVVNKTINRKGKVLIPVLGVGRAQEVMLILEEAIRFKKIPSIPIYIDGMVWDITAIHTAYPEFMNKNVRKQIFVNKVNPFLSPVFKRIGSAQERKQLVENKGPCVILATSGMLVGGPSVDYFFNLAEDKRNSIVFVNYQAEGSLGRKIQNGNKEVAVLYKGKKVPVKVNLDVYAIKGFSGHSSRNELLSFISHLKPKPRRVIINHGENSKCLDLASTIHKKFSVETSAPRVLDALRLR